MKFKMVVCFSKNGKQDGSSWEEKEDQNVPDPRKWAEETLKKFNASRNKYELPRMLLDVIIEKHEVYKEHDWFKSCLVTIDGPSGMYDTYECSVCHITGKRFGFDDEIIRDKKYKANEFKACIDPNKEKENEMLSVLKDILKKMEVKCSPKISLVRAKQKLTKAIEKNGVPSGLTSAQKTEVEALGFKIKNSKTPTKKETKAPAAKKPAAKDKKKPAAKPKAKKKAAAKKPEKERKKKVRRDGIICEMISKTPAKGVTMKHLATAADKAFAKAGGKGNLKQTFRQVQFLVPAGVVWGIVKMKGSLVVPA